MKHYFIVVLAVFTFLSITIESNGQKTVEVPANETLELEYQEYAMHKVTLKNKAGKGLSVAVLDKATGEQLRGFGLGEKGSKADILVEKSSKLVLKNRNSQPVKLKIKVAENTRKPLSESKETYISFTLRNGTAKSIPLYIPSVMNPNLSPFSNSGVALKIGQKIKFKHKLKKYVLLVVDENIKEGDTINVAKLLKKRKKELGIK